MGVHDALGEYRGTVRVYFENNVAFDEDFLPNEWVMFQIIERGAGLLVDRIWGQVTPTSTRATRSNPASRCAGLMGQRGHGDDGDGVWRFWTVTFITMCCAAPTGRGRGMRRGAG